jgi:pyocin large subunit-like protein
MFSLASIVLYASLLLSTSSLDQSAAAAMKFVEGDVKTVIDFSMDWAMQAGLATTSTLAFIVIAKRFVD